MSLNELWFLLVAVLFIGFFFLEGFDFGVGMSMRLLAKNEKERTVLVSTIGPFWDANEVWLLTAGGALFAAFPHWYATMFSGYYLPLFAVLMLLIGRGVSFEFRRKHDHRNWTKTWDWVIFVSSTLIPLLFGVLFTSLLKGMPIDENMNMYAGFTDYINVYSVWGGITLMLLCLYHGLLYITLRVDHDLRGRARTLALKVGVGVVIALVIFVVLSLIYTDIFEVRLVPVLLTIGFIVVMYVASWLMTLKKAEKLSFTFSGLGIAGVISLIFVSLFPRVMISSIDTAYNLTITNAASGAYSLKVMTIVACSLLPFVLGYQIWSYYVFRKRVTQEDKHIY